MKLSPTSPFAYPQAMLLLADSRFTLTPAGHIDNGRKIYPLTGDSALVFAGDALAAQRAVRGIRRLLRHRTTTSPDPAADAASIVAEAYKEEQSRASDKRRPQPGPLHILIGVAPKGGRPYVIRVSSSSGFTPLVVPTAQVVGIEVERRRMADALDATISDIFPRSMKPRPLKVHEWVFQAVAALQKCLEAPASATIGGKIQMCVVENGAVREETISFIGPGGDPVRGPWIQATSSLASVFPFRSRARATSTAALDDLDVEEWVPPT